MTVYQFSMLCSVASFLCAAALIVAHAVMFDRRRGPVPAAALSDFYFVLTGAALMAVSFLSVVMVLAPRLAECRP